MLHKKTPGLNKKLVLHLSLNTSCSNITVAPPPLLAFQPSNQSSFLKSPMFVFLLVIAQFSHFHHLNFALFCNVLLMLKCHLTAEYSLSRRPYLCVVYLELIENSQCFENPVFCSRSRSRGL